MTGKEQMQSVKEDVNTKQDDSRKNKRARLNSKKFIVIIAAALAIIILAVIAYNFIFPSQNNVSAGAMMGVNLNSSQNNMYMEEVVTVSDIVVGVTEMGSSSLLSNEISFEFQTTILEVVAKPGQYVEQGETIAFIDPELFEEQYAAAMTELESAELSLSQEQLSLQTTSLNASQTYDDNIINGENAQNVYNLNIAELESGYNEILAEITSLEAQKAALENQIAAVNVLKGELATLETQRDDIEKILLNVEFLLQQNITDPTDPAALAGADASGDSLISTLDRDVLTQNKTDKEAEIANKEAEIQTAEGTQQSSGSSGTSGSTSQSLEDQLAQVVASVSQKYSERDTYASTMELRKLDYYQEYEKSIQTYNTASTQYSVTVQTANNQLDEAELKVQELQAEVDALTKLATDGTVIATTSGYILSIQEEGATVNANGTIATIANSTTANVYVSIPQEDIADIEIDMPVNIVFDAYEDNIVTAVVDSISLTPSGGMSSSVNYTVGMEVYVGAFEGMVIFEGMTADVTFVEKQVLEVLVISNKCVEAIDSKQYVKMYDENGDVIQVEVTTGFSDGFDVEITSGLKEGDVVLIESAVSQNAA